MGRLNYSRFVGAFASTVMVATLAPRLALAACGEVAASKGQVTILSAQTKKEMPGSIGAKICSGDTITAGADSRAKLKMEDGNELNIAPDSQIVLENYQFEAATNKKSVLLNVLRGKVRAATKQENMYNDKAQDGADNSFQVKTKTAVAGVRGTDFMTSYEPKTGQSEVVTFRGTVAFGAPGPGGQIMNAVSVKAGQTTSVQAGQPPAAPKAVPPAQLRQMSSESKGDVGAGNSNGGSSSQSKAAGGGKDSSSSNSSGGNGGSASNGGGASSGGNAGGTGGSAGLSSGGSDGGSGSNSVSNSGSTSGSNSGSGSGSASGSGSGSGSGSASNSGSSSSNSSGSSTNSPSTSSGNPGSGGPGPASVTSGSSMTGGGSMLSAGDLGGAAGTTGPNQVGITNLVQPPNVPLTSPATSTSPVVVLPACTQCTTAIQTSNANAKSNVVVTIVLPH